MEGGIGKDACDVDGLMSSGRRRGDRGGRGWSGGCGGWSRRCRGLEVA